MKKLSSIMMIALTALAFQACKSNSSSSGADSSSMKDTAKKDTAMRSASATSGPVSKDDSTFVLTAAKDGMAEVNAGKIAQQKASSPRVKSFADMMVTDHTKAGDQLASIAKTKNINLPTAPDADAQKMADDLGKKSGKDFDKAYVKGMVEGHEKAVKLFTDASQNCKDVDLKAFATKTLPTLKMHLDSIKAIRTSMK